MRVLLTGAAGFIGSHVADRLYYEGVPLTTIDQKWSSPIAGLCNSFFEPTHIIHLAARAGVRDSLLDPIDYIQNNVVGMAQVLHFAMKWNAKLIYASSSSIHDNRNPYAASKVACEALAESFRHAYGFHSTGLRFFTVYGPRGRPDMAPMLFAKAIDSGQPINLYGTPLRDFTYVDDVVETIMRLLQHPSPGPVYDVGTGYPEPVTCLIDFLSAALGKPATVIQQFARPEEMECTCADSTPLWNTLGWAPQTRLSEGIPRFIDWYKRSRPCA